MYEKFERFIFLLFAFDSSALRLDLRKHKLEDLKTIVSEVLQVIERDEEMPSNRKSHMPNLTDLIVRGGTPHSDDLLGWKDSMERMGRSIAHFTPVLRNLHLPFINDYIADKLSFHPTLQVLIADRSSGLTYRGLQSLSSSGSKTRNNLRVFEVFSHSHDRGSRRYCKVDLCSFIQKMSPNLRVLNLHDENRPLVSRDPHPYMFKKFNWAVYSGYKMCIVDQMLGQLEDGKESFESNLEHVQIVDQQVKPKYLKNHMKNLKSLYIDWQEEIASGPWNMYERDWFSSTMLDSPDWPEVASRLTNLEVVFPSCHISPPEGGTRLADGLTEAYSLPVADCTRLLDTCTSLTHLKLRGAGIHGDFLSINCLVKHGTNLASISLQDCDVDISPLPWDYKANRLKSFELIGGKVTKMALFISFVRTAMPVINDLVIQPDPKAPSDFCSTVSPLELGVLGEVVGLRRLSVALSSRDFTSNMTYLFAILTNGFKDLECFKVGWYYSSSGGRGSSSNNDIVYKMSWLKQFLKAESVHLDIGLDFNHHRAIFEMSMTETKPETMKWWSF